MSQRDFERAIERMATDPAYAAAVRANPGAALTGYDLSDAERQHLAGMQSAVPAAAPSPATLATRRSKSSVLGIGAVGAVAAVGAATYGVLNLHPGPATHTYQALVSYSGGPPQNVDHVVVGGVTDAYRTSPPAAGSISGPLEVIKPPSLADLSAEQASASGTKTSITVSVKRDGKDWLVYQLSNALVSQVRAPDNGVVTQNPEVGVGFAAPSITVSYPNGQ